MMTQAEQTKRQFSLLLVDDEPNILSALSRLLRQTGHKIYTANSGQEALQLLNAQAIDLVISDMRMPEMNGAELLEKVSEHNLSTIRILLTGYADIESTIDAINKGKIYRYISKPWDENDLMMTINQSLEKKYLEEEKLRLESLTQQQNLELVDLNQNLEKKVADRVAELKQTMNFLELANDKLKKNMITTIQVFSNLMELKENSIKDHSRKVADLSRKMALRLELNAADCQDVMIAGLLHDIGKLGLPDSLLDKPIANLKPEEREQIIKHPIVGQNALTAIESLKVAASYIRSQHERFDGLGYPDGLSGLEIPLCSRILCVANDFQYLQEGRLLSKPLTKKMAMEYIREGKGSRYDPLVVDAFFEIVKVDEPTQEVERLFRPADMVAGMVISRDVTAKDSSLLLRAGHVITSSQIEQLVKYERAESFKVNIYVKMKV